MTAAALPDAGRPLLIAGPAVVAAQGVPEAQLPAPTEPGVLDLLPVEALPPCASGPRCATCSAAAGCSASSCCGW